MQGVLKFNLPEEEQEFVAAQKGGRYKADTHAFDTMLRGIIKYGLGSHESEFPIYMKRDNLTGEERELFTDIVRYIRKVHSDICSEAFLDE